jgi:hypothetical protein
MSNEDPQKDPQNKRFNPFSASTYDNFLVSSSAPTGSTISEITRVEELLRLEGKDPKTTTITEAKEVAEKYVVPAYIEDRIFYRWALLLLGIFVTLTILGICGLAYSGKTIPEGLIAIGSASIGAFVGIFSTTGLKK